MSRSAEDMRVLETHFLRYGDREWSTKDTRKWRLPEIVGDKFAGAPSFHLFWRNYLARRTRITRVDTTSDERIAPKLRAHILKETCVDKLLREEQSPCEFDLLDRFMKGVQRRPIKRKGTLLT